MASEVVRVLLVEDDPDDVVLVRAALKEDLSTEFALTVVSEAGQAAERSGWPPDGLTSPSWISRCRMRRG